MAGNGMVIEQSQILTTHNLAVPAETLDLRSRLDPGLAGRVFTWVVRRLAGQRSWDRQLLKNIAYAWRQAIFFLSFRGEDEQRAAVAQLGELVTQAGLQHRFGPAVTGLAAVVEGARFSPDGTLPDGSGRRLLGWTTGPHWCR
ncbi:hypothetical protein [Amycolatopsis sp. Hca4]|uniref:hypothetical protein n=1 Tax=Amycolatopsis sp. Hca4 TaxID=2742131 RepID=UPI0020CB5E4D|nr:hypothetical protein [Amycolatopsis sp. Hca4]